MKLEELSKEELIYLIKERCFIGFEDFEFDILSYRAKKCTKMESQYAKKANELLGDYIVLLNPYDKKPYSDIPDNIITQAGAVMKQREGYLKKSHLKEVEYKKIHKRMDIILGF